MKLNKVKYCLDCHEVWNGRDNTDCPACASVAVVWLKRWVDFSPEMEAEPDYPEVGYVPGKMSFGNVFRALVGSREQGARSRNGSRSMSDGLIKCFNRKCRHYDLDEPDHCGKALTKIRECPDAAVKRDRMRPRGFYFNELMSNQCACGKAKKSGRSFCYGCFIALSRDLRQALYQRIGGGYEEAYEEAVGCLEENVW